MCYDIIKSKPLLCTGVQGSDELFSKSTEIWVWTWPSFEDYHIVRRCFIAARIVNLWHERLKNKLCFNLRSIENRKHWFSRCLLVLFFHTQLSLVSVILHWLQKAKPGLMPESAFGREFSLVAMKLCVFILYLSKVYLVSCTSLSVVVLYASCCVWGGSLSHRPTWALFTHICEARCPKYYIVCTWVLWTDMWFEHVFESIKTIQWPDLQFGFLWVGGKETGSER